MVISAPLRTPRPPTKNRDPLARLKYWMFRSETLLSRTRDKTERTDLLVPDVVRAGVAEERAEGDAERDVVVERDVVLAQPPVHLVLPLAANWTSVMPLPSLPCNILTAVNKYNLGRGYHKLAVSTNCKLFYF